MHTCTYVYDVYVQDLKHRLHLASSSGFLAPCRVWIQQYFVAPWLVLFVACFQPRGHAHPCDAWNVLL